MKSRCMGMLFIGFALFVGDAAAAEVPYRDFARHEQFREVKLSPTGDHLAVSAVVDGKAVLSLIRLSDMKGVNLRPRESRELASFWWVSPTRVMYTVGERIGALEKPSPTGELYAVNADGTGDGPIFGYRMGSDLSSHIRKGSSLLGYGTLISVLRGDPRHALIAIYAANGSSVGNVRMMSSAGVFPTAARIDLLTGATTTVTTSPLRNADFMADHDGVVRFAYGVDADQTMKVWYRDGDGKDWAVVLDEARDHRRAWPLGFNRAQDKVYFSCGSDHADGVCVWDVATRKLSPLWSGIGLLELVPSFGDDDSVAIRSMPDRAATTLIDKQSPEATLLAGLMQQFPGEDVRITSSTLDGSKVVFEVRGDRNPSQFFLFDREARKASFLFASRPWIKPDQMAAVEPIALKARDGLALHGYLTRPPGKETAKNLPLVVFVHGGPYGIRDTWTFDPYVQMLASRGYAVLQVNFRGSGGYGEGFVKAGYKEWGGRMQDDVTDATRWAVEQGIADPKRMCIFGGSYGGYAAIEGAAKEPDLYRCAIGYVGVYDLRLMHRRGDIPQSDAGVNYLKLVLGDDDDQLWALSPAAKADRIRAKVMLVVGGQDTRVPPVQGEAMRAALEKAHVGYEWVYERTEGHGFYEEGHVEALFAKIAAFLDASIGAGAAPK